MGRLIGRPRASVRVVVHGHNTRQCWLPKNEEQSFEKMTLSSVSEATLYHGMLSLKTGLGLGLML